MDTQETLVANSGVADTASTEQKATSEEPLKAEVPNLVLGNPDTTGAAGAIRDLRQEQMGQQGVDAKNTPPQKGLVSRFTGKVADVFKRQTSYALNGGLPPEGQQAAVAPGATPPILETATPAPIAEAVQPGTLEDNGVSNVRIDVPVTLPGADASESASSEIVSADLPDLSGSAAAEVAEPESEIPTSTTEVAEPVSDLPHIEPAEETASSEIGAGIATDQTATETVTPLTADQLTGKLEPDQAGTAESLATASAVDGSILASGAGETLPERSEVSTTAGEETVHEDEAAEHPVFSAAALEEPVVEPPASSVSEEAPSDQVVSPSGATDGTADEVAEAVIPPASTEAIPTGEQLRFDQQQGGQLPEAADAAAATTTEPPVAEVLSGDHASAVEEVLAASSAGDVPSLGEPAAVEGITAEQPAEIVPPSAVIAPISASGGNGSEAISGTAPAATTAEHPSPNVVISPDGKTASTTWAAGVQPPVNAEEAEAPSNIDQFPQPAAVAEEAHEDVAA